MKLSEILAMLLIAAIVFIAILAFSTIYAYVNADGLQVTQIALAVVVLVLAILVAAVRRRVKAAEKIIYEKETGD